ncbi:Poc5 [Symbiodinium natans]|uniref:Centrosomal protein POC5 n=1 Tax=Symbiodinium natans TaxID=878477 RepID=A0A812UIW6_9DINO|nr:Poc5 [Symbiodinium natans]
MEATPFAKLSSAAWLVASRVPSPVQRPPVTTEPVAVTATAEGGQHSGQKRQAQPDSWSFVGLSGRLEDICRDLRRSVEHEFMLSERQLQAQFQADLEAQRLRAEAFACQQQAKIEALEVELKTTTKKLESKQKQVKESFALSTRVRQNFLARLAFERAFRSWQAHAAQAKEEQLQNKLASHQQGLRLVSALFSSWRQDAQSGIRERLIAHERAAAAAVRAKLFEQMETERAQLVAQVEDLKRQVSEEGKQRALLQDNLKRVFMRGVCALNFEAMSLLSDPGAAAGGGALSGTTGAAALEGVLASEPANTEPVALPPGMQVSSSGPVAPATPGQDCQGQAQTRTSEGAADDEALQPKVSPIPTPSPLPFVSYTGPSASADRARRPMVPKNRFPTVRREELAARG